MKPILHLLGDRYKAQQYVRFAERKLVELKNLMKLLNLNMQNRLYRFTTDELEVYIESYHGIDKIRINARKKARIFISGDITLPGFRRPNLASTLIADDFSLRGRQTLNITVDATHKIWTDAGTVVWTGVTTRYSFVDVGNWNHLNKSF